MKTKSLLFSVVISLSTFAFAAHAEDSKTMPDHQSRVVQPQNGPDAVIDPLHASRYENSDSQSLSHIPDDVNCAGLLGDDERSGYDAI